MPHSWCSFDSRIRWAQKFFSVYFKRRDSRERESTKELASMFVAMPVFRCTGWNLSFDHAHTLRMNLTPPIADFRPEIMIRRRFRCRNTHFCFCLTVQPTLRDPLSFKSALERNSLLRHEIELADNGLLVIYLDEADPTFHFLTRLTLPVHQLWRFEIQQIHYSAYFHALIRKYKFPLRFLRRTPDS